MREIAGILSDNECRVMVRLTMDKNKHSSVSSSEAYERRGTLAPVVTIDRPIIFEKITCTFQTLLCLLNSHGENSLALH